MSSPADTLIRIADVSMRRDDRLILDGINLDVAKGDFIAVTGPNGGGKTTLLRILLKLIKPTSGSVRYYIDGVETTRLPIGYLPQKNMIDSHFPISVGDVIASGLMQRRDLSKADRRSALACRHGRLFAATYRSSLGRPAATHTACPRDSLTTPSACT